MKRKYIYLIAILLTISLSYADFYIGKDLQKIIPLEEKYRVEDGDGLVKEANALTSLTIKNEQNSDETITYKYTIKIPEISGAYRYKYNDKENYLVFTANGETTIELKSNETLIIYDIPIDAEYTIVQETSNENYTIKVGGTETKTYKGKTTDDNNVTFNNSTKVEDEKTSEQPQNDTKKEDKKAKKKDIPNTGETEIKMILVLIVSVLVIYCFKKIKIRRFE